MFSGPTDFASQWRKIAKNLPQDEKSCAKPHTPFHTNTNAFAVEFEVLRSSVVSGDPETYSVTLLIQQYWRKQAGCCASTSSAAHCHVDLSWYKCHGGPQEGLAVLSVFVVRPWRSERVEAVDFQTFLYEQSDRIISGPKHSSCGKLNWKTSNSMANNVPPTRIYLIDINYVTTIRS